MTNFDRILTSTPLNKTAAVVARGKGVHWEAKLTQSQAHYDAPPRTFPFPVKDHDLAGVSFARFRVIGYLNRQNSDGRALWLVRCACGQYEERTGKAIRNPKNITDRCGQCEAVVKIRRSEYFHRTGKQMPEAEAYRL